MRVYSPRTRPSSQSLGYLQGASPNLTGATESFQRVGLNIAARGQREQEQARQEEEARLKKVQHFKALQDLTAFESRVDERLTELKTQARPEDPAFDTNVASMYDEERTKFLQTVPEELQPEFQYRADLLGQKTIGQAKDFKFKAQAEYFKTGVDDIALKGEVSLDANPSRDNLIAWKERVNETIDAADVPEVLKAEWKRLADIRLSSIIYKYDLENGNVSRPSPEEKVIPGSQADIMINAANELGVDPVDLATAISYETMGKFSTSIWGGKGGGYLGLIQFGAWEREKYGVRPGQSFAEQMEAVKAFLKDRGLKPGMTLKDIYSTINAGRPGRYNASDGPGQTVWRHVVAMNQTHRAKAQAIIEGKLLLDGIDTDPDYANIPYEDRLALRRDAQSKAAHADAEMARQAEEERQTRVTELFIGLGNGSKGRVDLDAAMEEGWVDIKEQDRADRILERYEREGAALRQIVTKLQTPHAVIDPSDPLDREGLNTFVKNSGGIEAVQQLNQEYVQKGLVPLITRAQAVPTEIGGMLTAMTRSNDPAQQMFALDTLGMIQDQAPEAFSDRFKGRVESDVALWRAQAFGAGYSSGDKPTDRASQILANIRGGATQEQRQLNEIVKKEAEQILTSPSHPDYKDFPTIYEEYFDPGFFTSTPSMSAAPAHRAAMQQEYNMYFVEEYARDGIAEEARKRATNRVKAYWAETDIGGMRYTMRLPPSKAGYRATSEGYRWIEEQVRTQYKIPEGENFQLISDEQTYSEDNRRNMGTNTNMPSYKVVKWDSNGVPHVMDGRIWFQQTSDELKREQDAYDLRQEELTFRKWANDVFGPATEHSAQTGLPVPEDIEQEAAQRRKDLETMRELFNANKPLTAKP